MSRNVLSIAGLSFGCALTITAFVAPRHAGASEFSFQGLGGLTDPIFSTATDITPDGQIVVGYTDTGNGGIRPFRWDRNNGMRDLGFEGSAHGVSSDGSVVVGEMLTGGINEAFRWTEQGGRVGLGDLAGGEFLSRAVGVAGDGGTVVGISYSTNGLEAFRWTSDAGMIGLGDFEGGEFASAAFDASQDGSVIVGRGRTQQGDEAFIWNADAGLQRLSDLSNGADLDQAVGISADGKYIVGQGDSGNGIQAFLRFADGAVRYLGEGTAAFDVSDNGRVVVGVGAYVFY
jgi:probable HAF family extracellular repeat protein